MIIPSTDADFEKSIEEILDYHAQSNDQRYHSILKPVVSEQILRSDISENAQYKSYYKAFFKYIKSICDKLILYAFDGNLSNSFRKKASSKIWIASREIYFIPDEYISDEALTSMIKAWIIFDKDAERKRGVVMKLGQYCHSEKCQEMVYSVMLETFNVVSYLLPPFKANHRIKDTKSYDEFLLKMCVKFIGIPTTDPIYKQFVITIVTGPDSSIGAGIITSNLNQGTIEEIADSGILVNLAIRFLINTEVATLFLNLFTPELCSKNKSVESLKIDLERSILQYGIIKELITFNNNNTYIAEFAKYNNFIGENQFVLTNYFAIDPEFIKNCSITLNSNALNAISKFSEIDDFDEKYFRLCMAFLIISIIPTNIYVPELASTSYEPLLDCMLSLNLSTFSANIDSDALGYAIYAPHLKITASCIEKLYRVLKEFIVADELEAKLNLFFRISLAARYPIEEDAIDAFRLFHEFYESLNLDFSSLTQRILFELILLKNYYLARRFYHYAKDNNLLSKSVDRICWKAIRPLDG